MKFPKTSIIALALAAAGPAHAAGTTTVRTPAPDAMQPANAVLKHFVDWLQLQIFPDGAHSDLVHWIACGIMVIAAILLRRVVTNIIFRGLKKLAERTETTLDDKLFPVLEQPVATFVMALGIFAAFSVLELPTSVDRLIDHGATIALLAVLFWGLLRAGIAVLDHLEEIAHEKEIGIAHFMPLIKRALAALVIVFGVLMGMKSLGVDVGAVLTGLGIGGLAVAFAAQDTIANLFGSFVVVLDHPFRVGDYIRIGSNEGTVEDIGLRSTRLRSSARTQIVLPNKTVAAEPVVNFTRMPQRRVDQTIGLTYNTTPEQMEAVLADIRKILVDDPGVHQEFVTVNFTGYNESSLDIQIINFTANPDFKKHLDLRERINLRIMRAVAARGLSFAYPTQTLHVEDDVARKLAGVKPAVLG